MIFNDFIHWTEDAPFLTIDGSLSQPIKSEDGKQIIFIEWDVDDNDIVLDDDEDFQDFCLLAVNEGDEISLEKDQYDRPYVSVCVGINNKEHILTRFFPEGN